MADGADSRESSPADMAVASIQRITQLISEIGFNMGQLKESMIAIGSATIDGQRRGVIMEIQQNGKARALAIAPYPGMQISDLAIECQVMDAVGEQASAEIDAVAEAAAPKKEDSVGI